MEDVYIRKAVIHARVKGNLSCALLFNKKFNVITNTKYKYHGTLKVGERCADKLAQDIFSTCESVHSTNINQTLNGS